MPREALTGSRIRERRLLAGLRQADLARSLGISASYLNLIEHNRRRIGGKLLVGIAQALDVEPSALTEGAGEALVGSLREAAADAAGSSPVETDRTDEFAGRFPGWAELVTQQHRRIATLERTVEALSDRLAHDPQLATSLHEVLSTAAAVRSVASILAEPGDLEPHWRERFTRNLNVDSKRLAESSKALVGFLDEMDPGAQRRALPRDEVQVFLAAHDFYFPRLERRETTVAALIADSDLQTDAARRIAASMLAQYSADAEALPQAPLAEAIAVTGGDPMAIAVRLRCPLPVVLRRLAVMPQDVMTRPAGLVVCDGAGALLVQKEIAGFAIPRAATPCPLWPLFEALGRPMMPVRRRIRQAGRAQTDLDCLAVAYPADGELYSESPRLYAAMLVLPVSGDEAAGQVAVEVGSTCRICPISRCAARREPSVLA